MPFLAAFVVITNLGFAVCFDTDAHTPAWVSYDLEPAELRPTAARRALPFTKDPRLPDLTDLAADYRDSGYDRGHLAPAADFNYDTNCLIQTYHYSNIVPQPPSVNRNAWLATERAVRALCAASSQTVHVVAFPLGSTTNRIGRVAVPSYCVKLAYGAFGTRLWIVPNTTHLDAETPNHPFLNPCQPSSTTLPCRTTRQECP